MNIHKGCGRDGWFNSSSIFNKHLNNGFELKKSITLRKDKSGQLYVNLFFEKKNEEPKQIKEKCIGIDAGINKLLSLSNGQFIGTEMKRLLNKLNRKQQGSNRYNRTLVEIKDYIGQSVNKIDFSNLDLIVMEDLKNITKNTIGRVNKSLRKQLGHWNIDLLFSRIINKCEENRVQFELVDAKYTSQICSSCGNIHKESRIENW